MVTLAARSMMQHGDCHRHAIDVSGPWDNRLRLKRLSNHTRRISAQDSEDLKTLEDKRKRKIFLVVE
jgi:hypothetical protein